jgi:hypothetical protein
VTLRMELAHEARSLTLFCDIAGVNRSRRAGCTGQATDGPIQTRSNLISPLGAPSPPSIKPTGDLWLLRLRAKQPQLTSRQPRIR